MATKNVWLWLGGAVIVILIAAAVWNTRMSDEGSEYGAMDNKNQAADENPAAPEAVLPTETVTPTETPDVKTPAKPVVTKPAAKPGNEYELAMETYKYRIQFVSCHGTTISGTGTLSVKKDVKFMLDNRDKKAHTIVVASKTYKVAAEKWAIVSIAKPGTYNVTCDGGGAATINVEG